ncbi:MAG: helix-turn-helix transcriptional regulator [Chloroflexota bacterium]|nr:helix-turn-helix transcriptional regulator [Chloroflexota bacterium]
MEAEKLSLSDLGQLVLAERSRRGMSLRKAARDTGIPFNTLARVEKGHVPDLPKFKRLVEWCGADIRQFFEIQEKATATTDVIADHLRADRDLPPEAAERISGIVVDLYKALARPQAVAAVHLRAAKTFRPKAAKALGDLLSDLNEALVEEDAGGPATRV